jgi:hypothetical protein
MPSSKPATWTVISQQAELLASLSFADVRDFEDAN